MYTIEWYAELKRNHIHTKKSLMIKISIPSIIKFTHVKNISNEKKIYKLLYHNVAW
jgi:hypothetical protein